MAIKEISPGVHSVGVNHWDRQIFDALVPLPYGTSYNSFVVKGSEKIALIDTVEPEKAGEFFENLHLLQLDRIDYIISNHAEQDHSGAIPSVLEKFPGAMVLANAKSKDMILHFMNVSEDRIIEVKDRDTISLGDKTLEFIFTPWSHWPDNMVTYLREDKILFSNDFLGAHTSDSNLFVRDEPKAYDAAKRYYAQIMMPFRGSAASNLKKVEGLDIAIIAPSHGQLHDKPAFILDAYRSWTSDTVANEVVIAYVTMHGSTKRMAEYLTEKLIEKNITVRPFNMDSADTGELAMATVNAATIILASPAVLVGAHPKIVYAAYLVNALKPKTRFLGLIGSYGWGSKLVDSVKGLLPNMKCEFHEPVLVKGYPDEECFRNLDRLADSIAESHIKSGLI